MRGNAAERSAAAARKYAGISGNSSQVSRNKNDSERARPAGDERNPRGAAVAAAAAMSIKSITYYGRTSSSRGNKSYRAVHKRLNVTPRIMHKQAV